METRSLLYFIAVAEEKNIGRAAARLHITQPALTRQIQSLEDELDLPLFTRTVAGMDLTPSGVALLQHARNIRSELELAKQDALRARSEEPPRLDIGVYGSATLTIIPKLLNLFSESFPEIELALHNAPKAQQIESLRYGKIQILFDRLLPEEPGLIQEVVCQEPLYLALPQNHRLAQRESIEQHELQGEIFMCSNDRKFDAKLTQMLGFEPKIGRRVDELLTALALVSSGFGVIFAPASSLSLQIPNVVYRPLADAPGMSLSLQCMYRENDPSPQLQLILDIIRAFRANHQAICHQP